MHVDRNYKEKYVMARVQRQRHRYQDVFSLREYGTWEKAEAAARRWIKAFIKTLPPEVPREGRMTREKQIRSCRCLSFARKGNEEENWEGLFLP